MSTSSFSLDIAKNKNTPLTLSKRLLWIAVLGCVQMIYIPTSNRVIGGIEPKLPIDVFPLWPAWVVPYILCYLLWFSSIIWIIFRSDDVFFRSFAAGALLTFSLGSLTFIFFPTYVRPAALPGSDIFTALLRGIHETWGRYDALPSGHVYITSLLALFFSHWHPRLRIVWLIIIMTVSFSTLFTAQHYILDVLAGYLVALAGYSFGLWWVGISPSPKRTNKRSDKRVPTSSIN